MPAGFTQGVESERSPLLAARYFGPPARRKPDEIQIPTPVGTKCRLCDEEVVEGDLGTINMADQVIHHECGLRAVIGSVGHLQGRCSCFGGTEEDPPGMSYRQAAIAATELFDQTHRWSRS